MLSNFTVWKFHDFSISQFLREIKVGDSRIAKSAILTYENDPKSKFIGSKIAKMAFVKLPGFQKLISRKI